jgi:CRISPR-associated endonuclease/helicase Cas3
MNALLGSLLGEKRSHPEKLLIDHLRNVAEFAQALAANQNLELDKSLLTAIALTHDIGKVHEKFQKLLDSVGTGINHAKPSAWFTYSVTDDILAAEIVCRHHTGLRNLDDLIADWASDQEGNKVMKSLLPDWPFTLGEDSFFNLQLYLYSNLKYETGIEHWFNLRLLYSLLIAADRMEAVGITSLPNKKIPGFSQPRLPSRSEKIDAWRQNVKEACLQKAKKIEKPGVYTLTLPTGAGKTLTGLAIAYEWARRYHAKSIIYGLPFISIVEQTASVAKGVFGNENVQEDHSLAYGKGQEGEAVDYSKEAAAWEKMSTLFRYWREPVVLTTMVHFWESLFNPKANRSMNFHRLCNAVVILDEPQTISPRYWKGFGQLLSYLSQKCNTFFLLMTATQPQIASQEELAPPNTFFPYNRHQYEITMDDSSKAIKKVKIDELAEILQDYLPVKDYSGLVVVNRKKAAVQAYRVLEGLNLQAPILLLSGWVTPYKRRVILRYLKWLEKNRFRHYLVATQVVEAGVDLDFGWVFRDLGPLDSIIQVAGRCNRHSRKDFLGKVVVAELTDGRGHTSWRNIYDEILIDKTKEVLIDKPVFSEQDVGIIVDKYYKKILDGLAEIPIFERLSQGQWGEYAKLFEEEEETYNVTVFIEENSRLLPMLKKLEETDWTLENRDEQKRLIQKVMQYAIEIPKTMISACRSFCADIYTDDDEPIFRPIFDGRAWLLRKDAVKKEGGLYNPLLGFIPPETDEQKSPSLL